MGKLLSIFAVLSRYQNIDLFLFACVFVALTVVSVMKIVKISGVIDLSRSHLTYRHNAIIFDC